MPLDKSDWDQDKLRRWYIFYGAWLVPSAPHHNQWSLTDRREVIAEVAKLRNDVKNARSAHEEVQLWVSAFAATLLLAARVPLRRVC